MVDSYDLNYLKTKFFQLRSVNATQKLYIFMISQENGEDYLLMGPLSKSNLDSFTTINDALEDLLIRGTVFPNITKVINDVKGYLVLEDPTRDYNLYVSQSRTSDNGSIVRINEFEKFTDICKQPWLYEDVLVEPKLPGYSPVSLLTTLTCLYILDVSIRANYIYIDTKKKQYYIFDLFDQRDTSKQEVDFFFVKSISKKCQFYERMFKYFNKVIAKIMNLNFTDEFYERRKQKAIDFLRNYSPPARQTSLTITPNITLATEKLLRRPFTEAQGQGQFFVDQVNPFASTTFSGYLFTELLEGPFVQVVSDPVADVRQALSLSAELYMFKVEKTLFDMFISQIKVLAIDNIGDDCYLIIQIIKALQDPDFNIVQSVIVEIVNSNHNQDIRSKYDKYLALIDANKDDEYLRILNNNLYNLNADEETTFNPILSKIDNRELYIHVSSFITFLVDKKEDLFNIFFNLFFFWTGKNVVYREDDTSMRGIEKIFWDIIEKQLCDVEGKISKDDKSVLYRDYGITISDEYCFGVSCLLLMIALEENKAPKKLLTLEAFDEVKSYLPYN